MISLNAATVVALLISTVIPLASSLLTTVHMPPEAAGIVTLALATVTGFLTEWAHAGSDFRWQAAASTTALSFLTAAVARARIWVGSRADAKALAIGSDSRTGSGPIDVHLDAHSAALAKQMQAALSQHAVTVELDGKPITGRGSNADG